MKKAPVHVIYKRYDASFVIRIAHSRVFAGMKWKFFGVRKRRERTFIHNLCPLCGRRRGCVKRRSRRAGPMCPTAKYALLPAGHAGPALQCGGHTGRTESSAPTRFARDVGDAVPYAPCHCKPVRAAKQVPLGYRLARQSVFPALAPLTNPPGWV